MIDVKCRCLMCWHNVLGICEQNVSGICEQNEIIIEDKPVQTKDISDEYETVTA